MKNKPYGILIIAISILGVLVAQDPSPLPEAPNQGPISGLICLALGGGILVVKKYFDRNK